MKKETLIGSYFRISSSTNKTIKYKIKESNYINELTISWTHGNGGAITYKLDDIINHISSGRWVLINNELNYLLW